MLFHRVGEVIVGVARQRDRLGRVQLLDARRGERQHLHVDAGRIHFRQPLGADVAQPVDQVGIAAADRFGAVFQLAPGTSKNPGVAKVFFKRYGAHGCYTPNKFLCVAVRDPLAIGGTHRELLQESARAAIEPYG